MRKKKSELVVTTRRLTWKECYRNAENNQRPYSLEVYDCQCLGQTWTYKMKDKKECILYIINIFDNDH